MPTQTPAGWRIAIASVPGLSEGMTSPAICVVMAAASRSMPAASMTLKPAHGPVAPVSLIISSVNCWTFDSITSAAFRSSARLWFGPISDHAGKAASAASTARSCILDAARRGPGCDFARDRVPAFERRSASGSLVLVADEKSDIHAILPGRSLVR